MKRSLFFLALLFAFAAQAQPDVYDPYKPCNAFEDIYYDLNDDGKNDIVIYVGSEGTEDIPSSSGSCFYALALMSGGYLEHERVSPEFRENPENQVYERGNLIYRKPAEFYIPWLMQTSYPVGEEVLWTTQMKEGANYFPIYMVDAKDTLIGWIHISINTERGYVKLTDSYLTSYSGVELGSKAPTKSAYHLGVSHGPNIGIGATTKGLISSSDYLGFNLNTTYAVRYGLTEDRLYLFHAQGELGFESIFENSEFIFAPKIGASLHLFVFDIGASFLMLGDRSSSFLSTRYDLGVSFNQMQLKLGFMENTDNGSSYNNFPDFFFQFNYFIPLN